MPEPVPDQRGEPLVAGLVAPRPAPAPAARPHGRVGEHEERDRPAGAQHAGAQLRGTHRGRPARRAPASPASAGTGRPETARAPRRCGATARPPVAGPAPPERCDLGALLRRSLRTRLELGTGALERDPRRERQAIQIGVALANCLLLARRCEPLGAVVADRAQHREPRHRPPLTTAGSSCRAGPGASPGRRRRPARRSRRSTRWRRPTAGRRGAAPSSSSSSWLHSIVARSVCWRGSAPRPPWSRSSRSQTRSSSSSVGEVRRARGGQLDRERQVVETPAELGHRRRRGESGSIARARERNSSSASRSASAGTSNTCSAWRRSSSRLVTRTVGPTTETSLPIASATSGSRCSALSTISSSRLPSSAAAIALADRARSPRTSSASATADAARRRIAHVASGTQCVPSG